MVLARMITKAQWEQREREWALWREWESSQERDTFPPEHVMSALGTILEWLPMDVRQHDSDPERGGFAG